MKSLQDYINIYKGIAKELNIYGDSVEILVQLLANATYINEVENISYAQEASIERATLVNSKIQHCMNNMYSVFRGTCPRVIIKFKSNKYLTFNPYDEIISMNKFKIYYLGYLDKNYLSKSSTTSIEDGFIYSSLTVPPGDEEFTIIGLLSQEVVKKEWTLNESNTYYVDCTEDNLSNDFWVKVGGSFVDKTRNFSDHILNNKIFDLTITDFGSRLYVADILGTPGIISKDVVQTPANTKIEAMYFKYSLLEGYNNNDLKKISIKGTEFVEIDPEWLSERGNYTQIEKGICYIPQAPRDTTFSIHYKANRDRYVSTILRSNSDIGTVLEEAYPEKIVLGGTSYEFGISQDTNILSIYYVPINRSNLLTESEIQDYIKNRTSYYITDTINIKPGDVYNVTFNITVELFQNIDIEDSVRVILSSYENKFNIDLETKKDEIKSLISKISNVKQIIDLNTLYTTENGTVISNDEIGNLSLSKSYFKIDFILNSIVKKQSV